MFESCAEMLIVYYISVLVLLTKELVIATNQCTRYYFKSPFYPGQSCEDIYNKNPESHERSGYYWITDGPSKVYCGMNYTGSSCEGIYNNNPETRDKSGYYRIHDNQWTHCNMTAIIATNFIPVCAGIGGGWRKIVHLNITAGDTCPGTWIKSTQSGVSFCRVASDNGYVCSSANFSTNGTSYQRVCGRARGYQKGYTWGFYGQRAAETIDGVYASGLSLTHGSPRQHIWTFGTGFSETGVVTYENCPCASVPGLSPPSFVGSNYYCETGSIYYPSSGNLYFFNDTLWDGEGCFNSNCCDDHTQPWFHHQLDQQTQDDIEARICAYGHFSARSTLIDQLELYIQ